MTHASPRSFGLALSLTLLVATHADAARFTVNVSSDDPTVTTCTSASCSLRGAVVAANGSAGHDEIVFASTVTLIRLETPLMLTDGATIRQSDPTRFTTVSARRNGVLFMLNAPTQAGRPVASFSFQNVKLVEGLSGSEATGGAIHTIVPVAALSLDGCTIALNSGLGAAVSFDGHDLRISNSVFERNISTGTAPGAALRVAGRSSQDLRVRESTFEDNSSRIGGAAVFVSAAPEQWSSLLFDRVYVHGNSSSAEGTTAGGAVLLEANTSLFAYQSAFIENTGGAVSSHDAQLMIVSSTFGGNTPAKHASSGVIDYHGDVVGGLELKHSTFAFHPQTGSNNAVVRVDSTVRAFNSFYGNVLSDNALPSCAFTTAPATSPSDGKNVMSDTSCRPTAADRNANALLRPLTKSGPHPQDWTYPPTAASPAIDFVGEHPLPDQRGRPRCGGADAGAHEHGGFGLLGFADEAVAIAEGTSRQVLVERRCSPHPNVAEGYTLAAGAGVAIPGDFFIDEPALSFDSNVDARASLTLNAVADTEVEGEERLTVRLVPADYADVGARATLSVSIPSPSPVSFSVATASVSETATRYSVAVKLAAPPTTEVRARLTLRSTTAAPAAYAPLGEVDVSFAPGEPLEKTVNLTLIDDDIVEPNDTYVFALTPLVGVSVVAPSEHTLTVVDDDTRFVSFTAATSTCAEAPGVETTAQRCVVELTLSRARAEPVSVTLTPSYPLEANDDFTLPSTTVVFEANRTTAKFEVLRISDGMDETDQALTLRLAAASPGIEPGEISNHTVALPDNDDPPILLLRALSSAVIEGGAAPFVLQLSAASERAIVATLAVGGNATPSIDYAFAPTVSLPPGTTQALWSVETFDDAEQQSARTLVASIAEASGANADPSAPRVSLVDNDGAPLAAAVCGDRTQQAGEACDDGNTNDGDGCSANCGIEGFPAPPPPAPSGPSGGPSTGTSPVCGNGVVEGAEACDDGNASDADGCTTRCTPTPPSVSPPEPVAPGEAYVHESARKAESVRGCQAGGEPSWFVAVGLLALARLARRRRR